MVQPKVVSADVKLTHHVQQQLPRTWRELTQQECSIAYFVVYGCFYSMGVAGQDLIPAGTIGACSIETYDLEPSLGLVIAMLSCMWCWRVASAVLLSPTPPLLLSTRSRHLFCHTSLCHTTVQQQTINSVHTQGPS